ncbi:hypothetical protein YH65_05980 [Sulfurovum lithotrophicum]|uniref:Uncharacterized protein n=1 Tax=Sulfurovum lithotrophicum TaxID=206403 RepID=A0A7U4RQM9_9BACT|nr:hypothetical protein [Sulfurovum lithotrophicum]AKF24990.1 hypothetical protein YH65_05980 [Sulfurovum lithotrophicum]
MLENILIYTIALLLFLLFVIGAYLEFFLIRKLYNEICILKKGVKTSLWKGYRARLRCIKGFATVQPYDKKVKQAMFLDKAVSWMGVFMIVLAVTYKLLGYGNNPGSRIEEKEKIDITVTKTEGNQSSINKYNSIGDMWKSFKNEKF